MDRTRMRHTGFRPHRLRALVTLIVAGLVATVTTVGPGSVAPGVGADNSLPGAIESGGVTVELRPYVQVPDLTSGGPPRLNAMATIGDRLFVVEEREGIIYEIVDRASTPRVVRFFDVAAAITIATGRALDDSNAFHSGLRSVAFHPDFETNGLVYVSAMETRPASTIGHHYLSDVPDPVGADSVLLEFTQTNGSIDPGSYREVFRVGMPVYDHTIRQIAFDPHVPAGSPERGLLYIAHGDGSEFSATAGGGQRNDALGKILRIDPRANGTAPYSVPTSNPFVGDPAMLDEVFSLGHRNPHTIAFAPVGTQSVLISGEAGRDNVEELNIIESGGDYGWSSREGTFVHLAGGGVLTGIAPLPADEADFGFTSPAAQYGHEGSPGSSVTGESIAGGFAITNGSALDGHYFAADFPVSGDLFEVRVDDLVDTVRRLAPGQSPSALTQAVLRRSPILFDHDADPTTPSLPRSSLRDVFDDAPTHRPGRADVRFGQGPDGELYITSKRNNMIYLVTNSVPPSAAPAPDPPTPDPPTTDSPTPDPPTPVRRGPMAEAQSFDEILAATDYEHDDARFLRLYRAFFDRDPDVDGARYWLGEVDRGTSFDDIAWSFAFSREFTLRYGALSDEEFIAVVYCNVLGRDADPAGQAYWLDQVRRRALAPHGVVRWIAESDEFTRRFPYAPI